MNSNTKIENIEKSMTWMLMGLIGVYVFVNVAGFLGPFWAGLRYESAEDEIGHSRDLLKIAQNINLWFSLFFTVSSWYLGKVYEGKYVRCVVVSFGICVTASFLCERLIGYDSDSLVLLIYSGFQFFSLIIFIALIRKQLRILRLS